MRFGNRRRLSGWRRSDESFLHEEFRFLAGSSNHLEGSLVKGVSGLRLPRDSLFHRLEGHRGRLPGKHVDLVHRWDDVCLVEALFLRDLCELLRRRNAHLVRDRPCTNVQGAAKDAGEPQAVVHLVWEIGPACGDDTGPGLRRLPWPNLRHRIRDHEEDGVVRHRSDPIFLDHTGSRLRCGDRDGWISHSFRSRWRMWKHFGCAMSSRFTPPNEGVMSLTVSMIFSGSFVARGIGNASTPPRYLNSKDLPSITGNPASGPMSPRPRTRVPSVTMAT